MPPYCTEDDLVEYVLQAYLEKLEEFSPGILELHINGVSAEIDDALRAKYVLPLSTVPETILRIAKVLASYRAAGSVTSLIDTAASSDNEFVFLQDMVKQARKDLEAIRNGKMDLGLAQLGAEPVSPDNIQVSAPDKTFNNDLWEKF